MMAAKVYFFSVAVLMSGFLMVRYSNAQFRSKLTIQKLDLSGLWISTVRFEKIVSKLSSNFVLGIGELGPPRGFGSVGELNQPMGHPGIGQIGPGPLGHPGLGQIGSGLSMGGHPGLGQIGPGPMGHPGIGQLGPARGHPGLGMPPPSWTNQSDNFTMDEPGVIRIKTVGVLEPPSMSGDQSRCITQYICGIILTR
jgi:hypothetical protein